MGLSGQKPCGDGRAKKDRYKNVSARTIGRRQGAFPRQSSKSRRGVFVRISLPPLPTWIMSSSLTTSPPSVIMCMSRATTQPSGIRGGIEPGKDRGLVEFQADPVADDPGGFAFAEGHEFRRPPQAVGLLLRQLIDVAAPHARPDRADEVVGYGLEVVIEGMDGLPGLADAVGPRLVGVVALDEGGDVDDDRLAPPDRPDGRGRPARRGSCPRP